MTDKIISKVDEFEDINLDIDIGETTEVKDEASVGDIAKDEPIEELDITLDDIETKSEEKPTPKPEPIHSDLVKENPLDDIDIDFDASDLEKVVEDKIKEIATDVSTNAKDVTVNDTTDVETPEVAKEAPKKRGRKSKAEKEAEEKVVEKENSEVLVFDPMFPVDKIDVTKYQTRAILHTEDEVKKLQEQITNQGQIEPIHIYNDGTTYHLLAGFKRLAAIKANGKTTIKAIIHTNISEEECIAISSGSNSERTELSEYDKIVSIGTFSKKNPLLSIDRLVNIFGFAKSTIYQYISYFKFFDKHTEYGQLFSKYRIPYFVYGAVYKAFVDEEDYSITDVIEYLKEQIENGRIERKQFEMDIITHFSEAKLDRKIQKENEAQSLDVDISMDDGIEDPNINKMLKENKAKAKEEDSATLENKTKINSMLDEVIEQAEKLESLVTDILAIENHKAYIDTGKLNKYVKLIGKIASIYVKFI